MIDEQGCYSGIVFVTPDILSSNVAEAARRVVYWVDRLSDEKQISRAHLSRLSGLSKQGITYMLNGEREPGIRSLCAIALALDVDVQALLEPIPDDPESDAS